MFSKILIVLAILVAIFLIVAALQPADFKLSRSTSIKAPPAAVFAQVNDLHQWENWSPWAKLDPSMTRTYEGPAAGEGASYAWAGNSKVGAGKMTITKSEAPKHIAIQLDFLKPMPASNLTEFTFTPSGGGTDVTWTMSGKKNFLAKAFHLIVPMEKLVGPDFEKGLAQLKAAAETPAK